ncbi:hypothetical protein FB451DRAFT_1549485 [Mycena latifolia]|nr:hypothetical protein FB451DRAFT_1549485 [Mycena latifolia]
MAAAPQEAPRLQAQELRDGIIDFLHGSNADLKACSLVCRSFQPRAQSHLFCVISMKGANRTTLAIRASRFAQLMSSSPHLLSYVRILHFETCDERILVPFARVRWAQSRVHTVSLGWVTHAPNSSALDIICAFVGIPSLRNLSFDGGRWESAHLYAIFARCNNGLESIKLFLLDPTTTHELATTAPVRLRIRELAFLSSPQIIELLSDPACPLDFSALERVRCVAYVPPTLQPFLLKSRSTIQSLHISGKAPIAADLDLALFPALAHLTIESIGPTINTMLARLPAQNCIASIRLLLYSTDVLRLQTDGDALNFGTVVVRQLPGLRQMTVEVVSAPDSYSLHAIKRAFSRIHEKGILSAVFSGDF